VDDRRWGTKGDAYHEKLLLHPADDTEVHDGHVTCNSGVG